MRRVRARTCRLPSRQVSPRGVVTPASPPLSFVLRTVLLTTLALVGACADLRVELVRPTGAEQVRVAIIRGACPSAAEFFASADAGIPVGAEVLSLGDHPRGTELAVVAFGTDADCRVTHYGCTPASANAGETVRVVPIPVAEELSCVSCCGGESDAGPDAGRDAGTDGAVDGGPRDAAPRDASFDAEPIGAVTCDVELGTMGRGCQLDVDPDNCDVGGWLVDDGDGGYTPAPLTCRAERLDLASESYHSVAAAMQGAGLVHVLATHGQPDGIVHWYRIEDIDGSLTVEGGEPFVPEFASASDASRLASLFRTSTGEIRYALQAARMTDGSYHLRTGTIDGATAQEDRAYPGASGWRPAFADDGDVVFEIAEGPVQRLRQFGSSSGTTEFTAPGTLPPYDAYVDATQSARDYVITSEGPWALVMGLENGADDQGFLGALDVRSGEFVYMAAANWSQATNFAPVAPNPEFPRFLPTRRFGWAALCRDCNDGLGRYVLAGPEHPSITSAVTVRRVDCFTEADVCADPFEADALGTADIRYVEADSFPAPMRGAVIALAGGTEPELHIVDEAAHDRVSIRLRTSRTLCSQSRVHDLALAVGTERIALVASCEEELLVDGTPKHLVVYWIERS